MIRRLVKFFASLDSSSKNFKSCCDLLCVAKTCYFLWDSYQNNKNGVDKFKKHLQELQYSSPCGHDLWRVLDDFLQCCFRIFKPEQKFVEEKVKALQKSCKTCCKPGQPCSCCSKPGSSSSCPACKDLLQDSELKTLFLHGYVSSYDSKDASWPSLTSSPSGSKCCSNSLCSQCQTCSSSGSLCPDPSKCCPDCPQRKAAKIFLGMLPCLYYGLKILYDRAQDPLTWPTWSQKNGKNILVPASILHAPDLRNFLKAWDLESVLNPSLQAMVLPGLLENLFSSGSLNSLFETSKKYFTSLSSPGSPSKPPQTVREILLWLYGLRFQKRFSELVENCKSLCLPFGNSFHPDAFCYYIHTCSFIFPVAIISTIETSESAQKVFSSSSEFFYPSDPSKLFETFCEYVRKIFAALNFLSIQCRLDRDSAGWKDCAFGQGCKEGLENSLSTPAPVSATSCCQSKGSHGILCASIPGISNCHEHCINGKTCLGLKDCTDSTEDASSKNPTKDAHTSGKCKYPCPHPLMRFLTATSNSNSKDYPFGLSGIVPMGFSQGNFPSTARWGQDLYNDITAFCESGFYPLTRLVQFILCVSQRPPESFLDLYAFFKKFVEALNSKTDPLKDHFVQWIDGEPGRYPGRFFAATVQAFYGAKDSHSGSSHSPANLFSLSGCHANRASGATCGPYLHPLTDNVAGVFTPELCSMYLSWICYRGPTFYSEFQKFHTAAQEKFSCCLSSSSCKKIVECPCSLPFIYSHGFTFMSPGGLNCVDAQGQKHVKHGGTRSGRDTDPACTLKSCSQFLKQLEKVVNGQPFKDLLKVIDNFLWSIRLPFFYGFLYVWFFVLSYFFYVILIKLDTFHTGSHLHLPRSFKILPSTLFSDASSKLKDLSYFTL
ncbi:variant erythrocyte surface antigen-1 family protein [Babesia divergens]|uniref:Variant erythrocyte surface antigen-1 family protein n=1 Tax=Babesia divergens TaxID=32595 RepID=A0AAD9LLQ8_BABDI|nr:variant erythrocyte surface antigen-1 family protein [Babesia divergens]